MAGPLLKAAALAARIECRARTAALNSLLEAANARGCSIVLIKGAATANLLYPHPDERAMGDLDLLARPQSLSTLHALLTDLGYMQESCMSAEFYRHHQHAAPYYNRRNGVCIEIHTGLFRRDEPLGQIAPFLPSQLWQGLRQLPSENRPQWTLDATVHFAYTACHWAKGFKPHNLFFGLADLSLMLRQERLDWSQLQAWAANPVVGWPLSLALGSLEQLALCQLPEQAARLVHPPSPVARMSHRRLIQRMQHRVFADRDSEPADWSVDEIVWNTMVRSGSRSRPWLSLGWNLLFPPGNRQRFRRAFCCSACVVA